MSPIDQQLAERARPRGLPVLHMRWEKLLFLHWRWDAADLQQRLPAGLTLDTFDGSGWLGIVPFFMRRVRPTGLPSVPWLSNFLELNVRTYVVDAKGRPGVWFFSLACNQPIAVELARRTFGLNYVHARMAAVAQAGRLHYTCARRDFSASSILDYTPVSNGLEAAPGSIEFFLLERYLLFAKTPGGRLVRGQVHHRPYRFASANAASDFTPARADGFADPGREPDHVAAAVDLAVEAWAVEPV